MAMRNWREVRDEPSVWMTLGILLGLMAFIALVGLYLKYVDQVPPPVMGP